MARSYANSVDFLIWLAIRVMIVGTLIFLVLPIIIILPVSFTSGELLILPTSGWSLRWYRSLIDNPIWISSFRHSLIVGFSSMTLATVLGTLAAFGLAGWTSRLRGAIMAILLLPMIIPVVIIAVGMFFAFSWLGLTSSYLGLILGHTVISIPFVVVTVSATLHTFDWRLAQAGASLGAPPLQVFRYIILPLILPGVASGAIFAFSTSFDDIIIALFVGNPTQRTLPREIFSGVRESITPAIAAVAIVLIVISLLLMITMEWLRSRGEQLAARPMPAGEPEG